MHFSTLLASLALAGMTAALPQGSNALAEPAMPNAYVHQAMDMEKRTVDDRLNEAYGGVEERLRGPEKRAINSPKPPPPPPPPHTSTHKSSTHVVTVTKTATVEKRAVNSPKPPPPPPPPHTSTKKSSTHVVTVTKTATVEKRAVNSPKPPPPPPPPHTSTHVVTTHTGAVSTHVVTVTKTATSVLEPKDFGFGFGFAKRAVNSPKPPPPPPPPHTSTKKSSTHVVTVTKTATVAKRAINSPIPPPPKTSTKKVTTTHSSSHSTTHTGAVSTHVVTVTKTATAVLEPKDFGFGFAKRAVNSPKPPPPPPPPHTSTKKSSTHVVTVTKTATVAKRAINSPIPPPPHTSTHVVTITKTATHATSKKTTSSHSSTKTAAPLQDFGFVHEFKRRMVNSPIPPPPKTTVKTVLSTKTVVATHTSHSSSTKTLVARATPSTTSTGGAAPISSAAMTLIEQLEGFRANFYDIDGDETIGYGHDCTQQGDCSSIHPPITQAQGVALLKSDLVQFEKCVCALPNASGLNANQYGALVSFTYNSGCGGVQQYFTSDMSSKDYSGICSSLPTTNTDGGELSSRRQKEGAFCSQATSDPSGC